MKVAIQGYEGCFHHIAAEGFFGQGIEIVPCATFRGVVKALEEGSADAALMAIENSIAGSILPNYGLLQDRRLRVVGELYLQIRQNLLVLPDVELEDIREVWSHPMALLQCADYLDDKAWRLVETEDTALSAKHIAENGLRHSAAIASRLAAEMFGLKIIAPAINTVKNNYTRFMILKRYDHRYSADANKASLYFKTDHKQGSLLRALQTMERVNMSKLQSYPIPSEPWHYLFHVDMEFDCFDDYIRTLDALQTVTSGIHVYGVYRKSENTY